MPSQLLHVLFGEDVAAGAGLGIDPQYRGVFALGCQGPDIFYHNRRTRPVALEYGSALHRRNYGIFCESLLASGADNEGVKAYALGFMTHAVLDRFCHPYIVYKSGTDGINHPFFERIIDVLMFKALRDQEIASWDQGLLAETCENPPESLKEAIARALSAAFPEKTGTDQKLIARIDNACSDSARFYRITAPAQTHMDGWRKSQQPVSNRFLSVIYPENLPLDIDFLNLKKEPWFYPYQPPGFATPQPRYSSFPEIYAEAVQAAVNAIPNVDNDCLSIHDEHGKPCAPNLIAPLPLDGVLQEQYRHYSL